MNIKNFFNNYIFKYLKKEPPTSEELHITYLLNNNKFEDFYNLIKNDYPISKKDIKKFTDISHHLILQKFYSSIDYLNLLKILNHNETLILSFFNKYDSSYFHKNKEKSISSIVKELDYEKIYVGKNFFNYIVKQVEFNNNTNKYIRNTNEVNTEFFKLFDNHLNNLQSVSKHFNFPTELIYLYIQDNPTTNVSKLEQLYKIAFNYHHPFLIDTDPKHYNSDNSNNPNAIFKKSFLTNFFTETAYNINQAKAQNSLEIISDPVQKQNEILNKYKKTTVNHLDEIEAFLESINLTESVKKSISMTVGNLKYFKTQELNAEDLSFIQNIEKQLIININNYEQISNFLDKESLQEYSNNFIEMTKSISEFFISYENNKITNLLKIKKQMERKI